MTTKDDLVLDLHAAEDLVLISKLRFFLSTNQDPNLHHFANIKSDHGAVSVQPDTATFTESFLMNNPSGWTG